MSIFDPSKVSMSEGFSLFQEKRLTEEEFRAVIDWHQHTPRHQSSTPAKVKPVLPEGYVDPSELHASVHSMNRGITTTKAFSHFPTIRAIEALQDDGWQVWRGKGAPYIWTQRRANGLESGKTEDTGKHLVTLRHPDLTGAGLQRGDRFPQLTLVNAHDGTSKLLFMGGLFELVCSNGMTSQRSGFHIGLWHRNLTIPLVIQKFRELASNLPIMVEQARIMSEIMLTHEQQTEFARAAIPARGWAYEIDQKNDHGFIERIPNPYLPEPSDLLRAVYPEQRTPTLWNTVQNVQRNLLDGGYHVRAKAKNSQTGIRKIRSVEGLELTTQVNNYVDNLGFEWAKELGADMPMPDPIIEPTYRVIS